MNNQNTAIHDLLIFAVYFISAVDQLGLGCVNMGGIETGDDRDRRRFACVDIEPWVGDETWRLYVDVSSPDLKEVTLTGTGISDYEVSYRNGGPSLYDTARELASDFTAAYRKHAKAKVEEARANLEKYGKLAEE